MADESLVIVLGPEWKRVSAELEREEVELPERFKADIREEADKKAEEARNKVRALPTHGPKHTGLRERVASGVDVKETSDGVEVTAGMDKADERNLPLGLDRPEGWSHPLFGNRHHWYRNSGGSWFRETFEDSSNDFEDNLSRTLDESARSID